MLQSPLSTTLRSRTGIIAAAACLLITGCASFRASSLYQTSAVAVVKPAAADTTSRAGATSPRVASRSERGSLLQAAAPFAWTVAHTLPSGEPLQTATTGRGGFRSLIIGSVGGHDPLAIRLTDDLARSIHSNNFIVGGIETTVLRTLNPDGRRRQRLRNAAGIYLNNQFPDNGRIPNKNILGQLPAEIQFLMSWMQEHRPQRVIHIRTIAGDKGLVAASRGAWESATEVANWLEFPLKELPRSVRANTLEYWAANREDCDVIMFGLPRTTDETDVWPLYGDAVVSLLLDGSSTSRELARSQRQRQAVRPTPSQRERATEMFPEDTSL